MRTFQCDRCKRIFPEKPFEVVGDYKIYLIEPAAIEKKRTANENPLFLCEDCKKELKKFMRGKNEL